jgi:hypothetical protein
LSRPLDSLFKQAQNLVSVFNGGTVQKMLDNGFDFINDDDFVVEILGVEPP